MENSEEIDNKSRYYTELFKHFVESLESPDDLAFPIKKYTYRYLCEKAGEYFDRCAEDGTPFTMMGLKLDLLLFNKNAICHMKDGVNDAKSFHSIVKEICHLYNTNCLYYKTHNTNAIVFVLKNHYGWKDTTEQEILQKNITVEI